MKNTLFTADQIRTASGAFVDILNPQPESIRIEDIAHALSNLCRWAGHTVGFYSVAQHSYLTASQVPPEHKMAALLHDATEAYLVDIPRPLKKHLPEYQRIEHDLMKVIAKRFGFQFPFDPIVKKADEMMLAIEWDNLMVCRKPSKHTYLPRSLSCDTPADAKKEFLSSFFAIKANAPLHVFYANNI